MGKQKYLKKIEELFKKSPVLDFKSIKRVIDPSGKSNYPKLLVSNLLRSGKIKKIAKGFYTIHSDNSLSVLCYSPAYIGLQAALSFHELWEQETIPVIITSKKVRSGLREVLGGNVLIRRTKNDFVFGFDYVKEGDFYLPYSDIEKTFIDMIYFKVTMGKKLIENFRKVVDEKKLKKYLKVYGNKIKKKVLKIYFEK